MEAINFLVGVFGLRAVALQSSSRVRGLSVTLLRSREAVRQRRPLLAEMVQALERAVDADAGGGGLNAVIAGNVLFAVFSRARVGDLTRCPFEPQLDVTLEGGGYVETKFVQHKTARPGAQRSLPITASARGIIG